MDLVVLNETETPFALRALRDVVASNGTITPAERRFIEVIGELHGTRVDVDTLASITPGEVAEIITEPHRRKRVVQLASIAAMVEGGLTAVRFACLFLPYVTLVRAYARSRRQSARSGSALRSLRTIW